jgi:hypothetical protein
MHVTIGVSSTPSYASVVPSCPVRGATRYAVHGCSIYCINITKNSFTHFQSDYNLAKASKCFYSELSGKVIYAWEKVKLSLVLNKHHAMKKYGAVGGIAPLFPDLCTR